MELDIIPSIAGCVIITLPTLIKKYIIIVAKIDYNISDELHLSDFKTINLHTYISSIIYIRHKLLSSFLNV